MEKGLTRYDLGCIKQAHDRAHYTFISEEELTKQLARIDLPSTASRFEVAMKKQSIEANMTRRGI